MKIHHTTYRKIIAALILLSCTCQLYAQGSKTYREQLRQLTVVTAYHGRMLSP